MKEIQNNKFTLIGFQKWNKWHSFILLAFSKKMSVAVFLAVTASFAFACMQVLTKVVQAYVNFEMVLFFRFSVALIILLPLICISEGISVLKTNAPYLHFFRAVTGFFALTFMVAALKFIPVTEAMLLNITYPLFTPLLLFMFWGTPISIKLLVGLVIGFMGVILILHPDSSYLLEPGSLFALASGLMTALAMQLTKMLSVSESNKTIGFYLFGFSTLVSVELAFFNWQTPSFTALFLLIGIGITGLIYQQLLSYVIKITNSNFASAFMYTSVIFGSLFSWWLWEKIPTIYTYGGFIMILFGSLIVLNNCSNFKNIKKRDNNEK